MSNASFIDRLNTGEILVADGATGSNLQGRGLKSGTPSEVWVLENPDQIVRLHKDFIEAGADIVLTSTFGGNRLRLESAGLAAHVTEVNQRAVALARQAAAGTATLIGASIGPVGLLMKPFGPLEKDQVVAAYTEQAKALSEAGADFLLIETQFDLAEASAATEGIRPVSSLSIVCSFSFDRGTHTMMGVSPAQAGRELSALSVNAVGINCGRSLDENLTALKELRQATDLPIWFKPNAGMPKVDKQGNTTYNVTPDQMGALVPSWLESGAQIVGGCCGTSPEHLKQIALAAKRTP